MNVVGPAANVRCKKEQPLTSLPHSPTPTDLI